MYCDRLLRENVENYGNLFETFETAIASLDKQRREETLGFTSSLSFTKMFRRLCVLQKQASVPMSTLQHLWETENETKANMIAGQFAESGLASHEFVPSGGEYMRRLRLHDSLHDFATEEAKRNCDTKEAHDCLLKGYKSLDPEISSEVRGTSRWWSRKLQTDGYIHRNLCRHLVEAGRTEELIRLLLAPEWARRQLEVNDVLYLGSDFSLGITALQDEKIESRDKETSEVKEAIQLISEAVTLSSGFISRNARELSFQLHGRVRRYCESNRAIREYASRIERGGKKPLILCKTSFLGEPGTSNTRIVSTRSSLSCMVNMKDGERFTCGTLNGEIAVVNVKTSTVENQWKAHDSEVRAITITRDGTRLISGSWDTTAKVWEAETGHFVVRFADHRHLVSGVAMMRDERRGISVCEDGKVRIWNMETGQILSKPFPVDDDHINNISCVTVLEGEEDIVITGGDDRKLVMWNVRTGAQVDSTFDCHNASIRCVAVTPDGSYVVSGSEDYTVRVWDIRSRQQVGGLLEGHTADVSYVAVSKDGCRIASGSWDRTIRVWELESQTEICDPLEGHTHFVSGVSFVGDVNDVIASCSIDGTVRVWDVRRKQKKMLRNRHKELVSSVSFTLDGRFVVSGSWDNTVRTWDATSGQQVGDLLKGHSHFITDVTVTPNGRFVVSVSFDETVCVWDLESRELLHTFTGHTDWIWCLAVTPQGDRVVTGSEDKSVIIWDMEAMDGSHVVLDGHSACVLRVFVSDDGLRAVSIDVIDNIFVWELESKKLVKQFEKKDGRKLSRRQVLSIVGESTEDDDITLSIPLDDRQILYGEGTNETILGTLDDLINCWALSPDKKTICLGLQGGQIALLKLER